MEPEDSSPCSNQPTTWPILSHVNHGQNLRYYFWEINFNIILPYAPRSPKCIPSFRFPNQNALCISILLVCATKFPPLIFLHLINTNNLEWGAKTMKTFIKQISSASCPFMHVISKYLLLHPIIDYLPST